MFLQDSTDVFEEKRRRRQVEAERGTVKTGPPPFSAAMGQATTALAAFSSQGECVGHWYTEHDVRGVVVVQVLEEDWQEGWGVEGDLVEGWEGDWEVEGD